MPGSRKYKVLVWNQKNNSKHNFYRSYGYPLANINHLIANIYIFQTEKTNKIQKINQTS